VAESGVGKKAWGGTGAHLSEMVRTALAANPGVMEARTPEESAPPLAAVATAATCHGERKRREQRGVVSSTRIIQKRFVGVAKRKRKKN
jgi:NAD(P)H-hydrate repair Nnr-like enzyme with NAD(P)H-hydrate dehydratase domain